MLPHPTRSSNHLSDAALAAPWQLVDPADQTAVTGTGQPLHGEPRLYYFIKVTNLSAKREVEVMAVGFDWAQHGHRVAVYSPASYADNIDAVRARGGITSQGRLEGFAPVVYCGTDVAAAMAGAEAVFVVGPAFATEHLARDLARICRQG